MDVGSSPARNRVERFRQCPQWRRRTWHHERTGPEGRFASYPPTPDLEPKPVRFLTQHGRGVQSGKEPRGAFPPMPAMAATHMASPTHGSRRTLCKLSINSRPRTQTCPPFDTAWTWVAVRQGAPWSALANAINSSGVHGISQAGCSPWFTKLLPTCSPTPTIAPNCRSSTGDV
jgi:hypothetical protein